MQTYKDILHECAIGQKIGLVQSAYDWRDIDMRGISKFKFLKVLSVLGGIKRTWHGFIITYK